jgi:hypothetical protein
LNPQVIEGEIVAVGTAAVPGRPRGSVNVLAVVSVVLLVVSAALGILLVRERSAHDEDRRRLTAQSARSVQRSVALGAELAVVRSQRDEAVRRLVREDGLTPEALAAIRACVRRYAEFERTPGGTPTLAQTACTNAEPYVR